MDALLTPTATVHSFGVNDPNDDSVCARAQRALLALAQQGRVDPEQVCQDLLQRVRSAQPRIAARHYLQCDKAAQDLVQAVHAVRVADLGALTAVSRCMDDFIASSQTAARLGPWLYEVQQEVQQAEKLARPVAGMPNAQTPSMAALDEALQARRFEPALRLGYELGLAVRSMRIASPPPQAQAHRASLAAFLGETSSASEQPTAAPRAGTTDLRRFAVEQPGFLPGIEVRVQEVMTALRAALELPGRWTPAAKGAKRGQQQVHQVEQPTQERAVDAYSANTPNRPHHDVPGQR